MSVAATSHGARSVDARHGTDELAHKRIVVGYGFWVFLLSDFIMFAGFFAAYAVLKDATAGGPGARELFDIGNVAVETLCLLLSSFTCGMAALAVSVRSRIWTQVWLLATGLLGLAFFALEMREFHELIEAGNGPQRSAFLSAFFTLVGCHGAHIAVGGLWLGTMMAQFWFKGFNETLIRRFLCFSLFWHALDIVWVAIFTIVYLMGAAG
ncbi:cytochrome c oxidase subunit 3 [Dokdonella sp.]|uniref:cytochrome c oxidase subunit 3 n=1 Tax=Dokdonella sp. TaxID=2291710 RepID=UPI001B10BAD9|nr:cytochrome c oxidase subunit 3 [Dokdonella sp.]MBO9664211.1 cytochrome c oxidase subunit 3 [Dokdonella sp.]